MKYNFKNSELEILWLLIKSKSISATAEQTGLAQANLSRLLTSIEDKIGFRIFDRTHRPLRLTAFGEALQPSVEQLLMSHKELKEFIEGYQTKPEGHVVIHATVSLLMLLTKHILPVINNRYPAIDLALMVTNLGDNDYTRGADFPEVCDMLFTHVLPQNEDLVARKICSFSANIYARSDYIVKHPVHTVQDYSSCNCIQFNFMNMTPNVWSFTEDATRSTIRVLTNGNIICDNLFIALASSAESGGYVLSPGYAVRLFGMEGKLLPTLPEGMRCEIPCYLIYRKRNALPYRVQVVINCITQILTERFSEGSDGQKVRE